MNPPAPSLADAVVPWPDKRIQTDHPRDIVSLCERKKHQ